MHRVPGVLAGHQLGDVSAGAGNAEFGESLPRLGITHHSDVGSLPVAPAGGEARVVEDPVKRVVGQRFIGEFTHRVGGSHDVVEVHNDHLLAVSRRRVRVGCGGALGALWCEDDDRNRPGGRLLVLVVAVAAVVVVDDLPEPAVVAIGGCHRPRCDGGLCVLRPDRLTDSRGSGCFLLGFRPAHGAKGAAPAVARPGSVRVRGWR